MEASPQVNPENTLHLGPSDSSAQFYLYDSRDIRDMLISINDTNGVVPAGPEHPIMANLFVEERKTMSRLEGEIDGLLYTWLEKKKKFKFSPKLGAIQECDDACGKGTEDIRNGVDGSLEKIVVPRLANNQL
ncbi:hypothetical protein K469DRAFT_687282 [Zopfia rhizophila CBS 207.26]|uniref:Uncharacterized protein n=1 Tax=Zopfia rhizophila CBS 207.26 TaxID=1314779 RepID=A0A6A6E2W6_9PEZI|nr:hypothetical protein K469DRAFT_687282 [Zopfia rhizophila CBS 207.26]